MDEISKIVKDIQGGNIKPIYFLAGEEPYYIDKLSEFLENNLLTEDEKSFNQTIYYGRDVSIEDIISTCKRFPMMAERQVVIVREAQDLVRTIENLEKYAANPTPTTVLVICYKYKMIDKRKKLYKDVNKTGLYLESKKLYDNQVGKWIVGVLAGKKYGIEAKAAAMLVDFLGTDLAKINNELEKLQIILPEGSTITPKHIEENIGFSKDFNIYEFRKAIGYREEYNAYKIAHHFAQNAKEHPMVATVASLYSFFAQLMNFHALKDRNPKNVAAALGINPFFVKDVEAAGRSYPMKKVSQILATLRDIDGKGKGVGAINMSAQDLHKELLFNIFK